MQSIVLFVVDFKECIECLLNLNMLSALFTVSGMAFDRMLLRNASEFIPKDIVLVGRVVA